MMRIEVGGANFAHQPILLESHHVPPRRGDIVLERVPSCGCKAPGVIQWRRIGDVPSAEPWPVDEADPCFCDTQLLEHSFHACLHRLVLPSREARKLCDHKGLTKPTLRQPSSHELEILILSIWVD
jgi:hypothetical protein